MSSTSKSVSVRIRPFGDADYAAHTRIHNAIHVDNPEDESQLRHFDDSKPEQVHMRRFVGEVDGAVVACASWCHSYWAFNPLRFHVIVRVLPELQGNGIGRQMWQHLLDSLLEFEPATERVRTYAREDWSRALHVADAAGFVEETREFESRLDLTTFDLDARAAAEARPWNDSIRHTTLREFIAARPDDGWQLVHALDVTVGRDVPSPDPVKGMPYEAWLPMIRDNPRLLLDGIQLALDGDQLVGMSAHWGGSEKGVMETGLTGVMRSHRRRGIATALKLSAIRYALANGYREIRTDNDTTNRPMLSINEDFGYVKQPAWLDLVKVFTD